MFVISLEQTERVLNSSENLMQIYSGKGEFAANTAENCNPPISTSEQEMSECQFIVRLKKSLPIEVLCLYLIHLLQ